MYKGKYNLIMTKMNVLLVCLFFPFFLLGQKKKKEEYIIPEISGFVFDAKLNNWEGHLFNPQSSLWSFGIVKSGNKLFAAARIKNQGLIKEAIRNGILLNISYSDKKKDGAQIIFPRLNLEKLERQVDVEELGNNITNQELIQSSKGYYVKGFERVVDGLLSFNNQYGIHASCTIGTSGDLVYLVEVPLDLVKFQTKEIAVQLAVNTQFLQLKKMSKVSANSNINRGYYGFAPSTPQIKNPYEENIDVWFKGILK